MKTLFLSLIFITSFISLAQAKPTIEEYRVSMREHRVRVLANSQKAIEKFIDQLPALQGLSETERKDIVYTYFSLHDLPKMMNVIQMAQYGYFNDRSFLEMLHKDWGRQLSPQPVYIKDMNALEEKLKTAIMVKKLAPYAPELRNGIMSELKMVERSEDVVDTKFHRGMELGFENVPHSAKEYLRERNEFRESDFADHIEDSFYTTPSPCPLELTRSL